MGKYLFLIAYIFLKDRRQRLTNYIYFAVDFIPRRWLQPNLSKYPAAVDDEPNEFLPPFSRERKFAILVDDTVERSPEGRFNFAKLADCSRKICIATLETASIAFLTLVLILECHSDVRSPILTVPTEILKRRIRAI